VKSKWLLFQSIESSGKIVTVKTPETPRKFIILKDVEPKIAPLSMQTSHQRALNRLKANFADQTTRIKIKPTDPDSAD
jgi:hypothetical protein